MSSAGGRRGAERRAGLLVDQRAGGRVDEPDIVKTDGRTVYAIADGKLRARDVTGATPRLGRHAHARRRLRPPAAHPRSRTEIHRFEASKPSQTSYASSGSVAGFVLNQYSLNASDAYRPPIGRSLVIGQTLFTISYAGLAANRVDNLASLSFTAFR